MRVAVVSLVLVAAGAGCGESGSSDAGVVPSPTGTLLDLNRSAPSVATSIVADFAGGVDGPVMFSPGPPTSGGDDALIEGTLVRDGDCLFVGDGVPGSRYAVLWPFGTTWDAETQEVVGPDGTRVPLGSTLSAGGGYGSPDDLQRLVVDDALAARANACAEGKFKELAVVQHSISTSVRPSLESADGALPLHQQNPTLEMGVDGTPLVELSLGFDEWNDVRVDPATPEPSVGVVVSQGAELSLLGAHRADATVTLFRLDETLRLVQDTTIRWNGMDATVPAPRAGTWFVDVRAVFGPSPGYEGNGVLRAGVWLHVTPSDAPCDTPSVTPMLSPDSAVTGVVDGSGCPVVAADATLRLSTLTPWFHCAPWPPMLQWRTGDEATMKEFWQFVFDPDEIAAMAAPNDAVATGRFIAAGELLTSASEPDAIYVRAADGSTQRWSVPGEEIGCD